MLCHVMSADGMVVDEIARVGPKDYGRSNWTLHQLPTSCVTIYTNHAEPISSKGKRKTEI